MELQIGDEVSLIVVKKLKIGFTVLINEEYEGILYKNELYQKVYEGDKLTGFVKNIREDEKLDVSLQPVGFKRTITKNEVNILAALKKNEGFLPLHDKSSPDDIKYQLGMSKKAFKNAIGGLYRLKLIVISDDGINLSYFDYK